MERDERVREGGNRFVLSLIWGFWRGKRRERGREGGESEGRKGGRGRNRRR